jgi:3'-phosphoadenosine 5'-phosphosulfate sulfotransferase (PAPS reductase)/FAD synthetase
MITTAPIPTGRAFQALVELPPLWHYDAIVVSTSGGKDSQAMLSAVVALADEQGFHRSRITAVHADLGRAEWKGTTALVKAQCAALGVELTIVKRPQGDLLDHALERGKWFSSAARYCTSDHKRGQIHRAYTALVKQWRIDTQHTRACRILECLGIRAQESTGRAKKDPCKRNDKASNGRREVTTWMPIFKWSEADVWATIKASGLPHHEAYDLGMPRLSCVFCIMAGRDALLLAGTHNRELLDRYVEVEDEIGHSFQYDSGRKQEISLRDLRTAIEQGEQPKASGIAGWDSF